MPTNNKEFAPINIAYIAEIESNSGKNKASRTPNSAGALGTYQITPIAWKDLQQMFPQKYGSIDFETGALNDEISSMAAQDIFNIAAIRLKKLGLPVTTENLLAVYNAGIGTVSKANGNIAAYPLETRKYIRKYKALEANNSRIKALKGKK